MATRPTLPYYAPAELLPAPLPTVAEILASKHRISHEALTAVVRVGDHYAVKYGARTSKQEGENMLFVQQSTSIPVPKVYAIFEGQVAGYTTTFIVMEYIDGTLLNHAWGKLSASEKRHLVSQLRRYMDELRIPAPGYYGGVWGQKILNEDFEDQATGLPFSEPEISGPHETEEQFVEGMWHCLDRAFTTSYARGPEQRKRLLADMRRHYHNTFKGHKPVFTHADFFRGNIMLRRDGSIVIIDWEYAGWYPSFWEFCYTIWQQDHTDDWNDLVYEIFLDEYSAELGWFRQHRGVTKKFS